MNSTDIQKYSKLPISKLIARATIYFNQYIRLRDKDLPCISCGSWSAPQAGHYLSAGHHSALRFNEFNTNRQCNRCNNWLSGNLINYRIGLVKKIGVEKVEWLENFPKTWHKWDRFTLIEIITTYKSKVKQLKSEGK